MKSFSSKVDFIPVGSICQSLRRAGFYAQSSDVYGAAQNLGIPARFLAGRKGRGYTPEEANRIRQRVIENYATADPSSIPSNTIPTIKALTDAALVGELRSRGWDVIATRTKTETL